MYISTHNYYHKQTNEKVTSVFVLSSFQVINNTVDKINL